jgi:hypothetical protein
MRQTLVVSSFGKPPHSKSDPFYNSSHSKINHRGLRPGHLGLTLDNCNGICMLQIWA